MEVVYHAADLYKSQDKRHTIYALNCDMKEAIRAQKRTARQSLSRTQRNQKNCRIHERLFDLPEYETAKSLLIYISTDEEVDTHAILDHALKTNKKVYAPKLVNERIAICPVESWEELEEGAFGILEPCRLPSKDIPTQMDLILVPGIAFDPNGNRIGFGKGHYDRLLKEVEGLTMALAFEVQMAPTLPQEAHDVPLNCILTDEHFYRP